MAECVYALLELRDEKRGKCAASVVMARYGDTGPYSKANVYVTTHSENIRDGIRLRRESERSAYSESAAQRVAHAAPFSDQARWVAVENQARQGLACRLGVMCHGCSPRSDLPPEYASCA